jgi:hypothetical protein
MNTVLKNSETFQTRADEAAEEARTATLENVRVRALRAEATWRQIAERAKLVEQNIKERKEEGSHLN